ncbi:unnamed protein product [Adineta steineri]|uniref:Peptidase S9 prolyl oligopeptidase catalytic domain-containing protein n=1 Tax=Adineta steineri TaxID=433720 RepID=A0A814H0S3_9BILA|nr:unnamed protein product [Adineta steineri]CAF4177144.1 unnamed protein product [Adineta steineri]
MYTSLSWSPSGQYLLIQAIHPSWNDSRFENILWIYNIKQQHKTIITRNLHKSIKPQWSPNGQWIALLLDESPANSSDQNQYQRLMNNYPQIEQYIYLYSLSTNDLLPVQIGKDIPLAFTWPNTDLSLYLATINTQITMANINDMNNEELRDVIHYRQNEMYEQSSIYRIVVDEHKNLLSVKRNLIKNVSFLVGELLFVPSQGKLLITSVSPLIESLEVFEIYSIDLRNTALLPIRLTDDEAIQSDLKLSIDGTHVLFLSRSLGSGRKKYNDTQARLYSMNLIDGQTTPLAQSFYGNINTYAITSHGSLYILGQLGTEVQVYSQESLSSDLILHSGWNGTYESITVSSQNNFIAFIYSSTQNPMEVYIIKHMDELRSAQAITNENKLFTQRSLPQSKAYQWKNEDDHQMIEGLLHYPPGKFQAKNLPLLVLIHGGPYEGNTNSFSPDWYSWAPLAATEGWLVLEPNYRGSVGYGDKFMSDLRYRPLSLPGRDILYGVDQLIRDGIVDPLRVSIGGYSYGGFLTNWLITQTKRFNAALSSAGTIELTSSWGAMNLPALLTYLMGGFPWEVPHIYQSESPMYQLDRVRTPTLITTGENDVRVSTSQSYMLERGLYYRGVPVKLITFPNEGHALTNNPWHGKAKVREELKWLKKYGNQL